MYCKGESHGYCQIFYAEKEITCKELVKAVSEKFEEKAKIMICSYVNSPEKTEVKANRVLEESDINFFEKYSDKQIGVELPGTQLNKNELRITEINNHD